MQLAEYTPSAQVLHERSALAEAFSSLRRVRPRVPFWCLAAHRIPTLWSLYRGLMREAPGDDLRWRAKLHFERYKSLTSPLQTRERLLFAHKLLDAFRAAKEGHERMAIVLARYEALIAVKREKARMETSIRRALDWQARLRTRPILTGSCIRPTLANGPLPRMKPQPEHITMMIHRRRGAYERQATKLAELRSAQDDFEKERAFENRLILEGMGKGVGFENEFIREEWEQGIKDHRDVLKSSITLARQRAITPLSPQMLSTLLAARREKVRNKTSERERERRGEVLQSTLRRRRKGPPAHVLDRMSEEERKRDKVLRGVSEVGYVGMLKSKAGRKMRDPGMWRRLEGETAEDDQKAED